MEKEKEDFIPHRMKAFPTYIGPKNINNSTGMHLRDYFAIKVLPTLLKVDRESAKVSDDKLIQLVCIASYKIADAMMEARKK